MFVATDPEHTEADAKAAPDIEEWFGYVTGAGKHVIGDRLRPASAATTVRRPG